MAGTRARHLVPLLLLMTVVTGLVDAVSYLALGRVFVPSMTGNVVFLGFAWAGDASLSAAESLLALLSFSVGAVAGGGLATRQGRHRGRRLAAGSCVCLALLVAALVVAVVFRPPFIGPAGMRWWSCWPWRWACKAPPRGRWASRTSRPLS